MDFKIRVDYADVEVYEDSWDEGELDYVNSWDLNHELKHKTFNTVDELVEAVAKVSYCFSNNKSDYVYIDGRISTDATVNENNEEPDKEEYAAWKSGELMLYVARLTLKVTMIPAGMDHEMTKEEAERFGLEVY